MEKREKEDEEEGRNKNYNIAAGIEAGNIVNDTGRILDQKYYKPEKYTGNRKLYDSPKAKVEAKRHAFQGNKQVKDPYTGETLFLRKQEAKAKFGNKWKEHLAEADHTVPIEKVHQEYKKSSWVTNENIRDATNSEENIKVISRKINNAKRSRTNEDFVNDDAYLKDKDIRISKKGKEKARKDSQTAKKYIKKKIIGNEVKNVVTEFHDAGIHTACSAAAMTGALSTIENIVAVIKGEKKTNDALKAVAIDTGASAASAYIIGGSMSVVAHSLSNSSSAFVKSLVKSNVPGKIVSAVMATGDVLLQYSRGKISTSECIICLGEKGVGTVISGYSMAVGQVLIPIPFVGAAVGAMVGAAISGSLWNSFQQVINSDNYAQEEYAQVKMATDMAIAGLRRERDTFEAATNKLFKERSEAINAGFEQWCIASLNNDFDSMVDGLTQIAGSFDKNIQIHSFQEFDNMMNDDTMDFDL